MLEMILANFVRKDLYLGYATGSGFALNLKIFGTTLGYYVLGYYDSKFLEIMD